MVDRRGDEIRDQLHRRDLATVRGELAHLRTIGGAPDMAAAAAVIRRLVATVEAQQAQIKALSDRVTALGG